MSRDHLQRRSFQFDDAPRTTIALEPGFWCLLEHISVLRRLRLERVVADALAIQGELDRAAAIRLYVGNYFYKSALDAGVVKRDNRRGRASIPKKTADGCMGSSIN